MAQPIYKLGVDIDGVLTNTPQGILDALHAQGLGKDTDLTHIRDWAYSHVEGCTLESIMEIVLADGFSANLDPMPFASLMSELRAVAGVELHLVTARPAHLEAETREWLRDNEVVYDNLTFVKADEKADYATRWGLHAFVEDNPTNATRLAEVCPVYLMDWGYNRSVKHPNIKRVNDLMDVYLDVIERVLPAFKGSRIDDKQTMYRHFLRGEWGNNGVNYGSWLEARAAGQLIGMRDKSRAGGRFDAFVPRMEVQERTAQWIAAGTALEHIQYSEMTPRCVKMNGEVMRSALGLVLEYSTLNLPMRAALKAERKMATGITALHLLRSHMDATSADALDDIFDQYPDAVVEFTVLDRCWGDTETNCIFWEVRSGY